MTLFVKISYLSRQFSSTQVEENQYGLKCFLDHGNIAKVFLLYTSSIWVAKIMQY